MVEKLYQFKPKHYGGVYLLLIPFYATVYYIVPNITDGALSFLECLYFSTVTITTLGYGDITPINDSGKIITASESILGIVFIGLFLNALSHARSETSRNEQIEKEKNSYLETQNAKLYGHYSLVRPLINKYKSAVIQVTSPLGNRSTEYNPDFTLNDMKDLHGPILLMTQSHNESPAKFYFDSLKELASELSDMVKSVDLRHFPSLGENCLEFLSAVHTLDFSEAILDVKNTTMGGKPQANFIHKLLEEHTGEVEYLKHNTINGYVALYHQIKLQMPLVNQIDIHIKSIISEEA